MKNLQFAISILLISAFPNAVHATSGGLNSSGCHNSKTAGYHCHRSASSSTPRSIAPIPKTQENPKSSNNSKLEQLGIIAIEHTVCGFDEGKECRKFKSEDLERFRKLLPVVDNCVEISMYFNDSYDRWYITRTEYKGKGCP